MKIKELAAKKQEERKLIQEAEKQIQGQLTISDNKDVLGIINDIYLPDIITRYKPCLQLAADGKNFIGCNNNDYKAMFYDKSKNILITNGCHYVSDNFKGYSPFIFVREHFCNGDNVATYAWFKENYPHEMRNTRATNMESAEYYELIPKIRPIEEEQNLEIISFNDVAMGYIENRRKIDVDKICKYGIKIIDDHLGGIMDSELVVIGAETGIGKSELAYISAMYNAINGKRVMLLSLEGDISEIAARHLHKNINAKLNFDKKVRVPVYRFNLDKNIYNIEDEVFEEMKHKLKDNLWLFDKKSIPTIGAIKNLITKQKDNFDLIIIDHLHYIYLGDTIQENAAIGGVMRELKTITDIIKKPILLVSHLRKKTTDAKKKSEPDLNDLYGSSNIAKEATTILFVLKDEILHHHFGFELEAVPEYQGGYLALTKIKLLKSRSGLAVPTSFHLIYDMLGKKYLDEFQEIFEDDGVAREAEGINSLKEKIKGTTLD